LRWIKCAAGPAGVTLLGITSNTPHRITGAFWCPLNECPRVGFGTIAANTIYGVLRILCSIFMPARDRRGCRVTTRRPRTETAPAEEVAASSYQGFRVLTQAGGIAATLAYQSR